MQILGNDSLSQFMKTHATWDPMLLWDGNRWLLYLLAMDRTRGVNENSFFTNENYIHGFISHDLSNWQDLGPVIKPWHDGERLCAGNFVFVDGVYYFFGSSTICQFDSMHLDQRLFLATSIDGTNFKLQEDFHLDPDSKLFPHERFHPHTGEMLFAWRDPYSFYDPDSECYYLFICTGGERWGRAPNVAVASSKQLHGPYTLVRDVIELPNLNDHRFTTPLREIERVQIHYTNGKYFLTFSCWSHLVDKPWFQNNYPLLGPLNDSTVYIMESDEVTGPYRFSTDSPTVGGSEHTSLYGTSFLQHPDHFKHHFAVGWDWKNFTVNVSGQLQAKWSFSKPGIGAHLTVKWPIYTLMMRHLSTYQQLLLRAAQNPQKIFRMLYRCCSSVYNKRER